MRLGVDVGDARIGVAASDASGTVVVPLQTVPAHPRSKALREIIGIARERGAIEIVVGLPRNMRGDEGPAAAKARKFAKALVSGDASLRVCLIDERLSTSSAQGRLVDAGVQSKSQRNVIDQVAAQIILERALEIERSGNRLPGETVSMVTWMGETRIE